MEEALSAAVKKMEQAGVSTAAINVFRHYFTQLKTGQSGFIPESSITPLTDVDQLSESTISTDSAQEALSKTVILKLNGGLGTSMGMAKAKSLLPVRDGLTFLDIICRQVLRAREKYQVTLPLIFMNSFRTSADTLEALSRYDSLPVEGLPLEFLQNQEPKLLADSLYPVSWPKSPDLEWCPPGHGDIYTALYGSGLLEKLLEKGYRYACSSNSDNLGATPSAEIAGWFAASGAPYAAEVCTRTANDLKGGHLAIRKSDGQVILRDTAQTPSEDMHYFTDRYRHPYFHTNNLWFDLQVLYDTLQAKAGVLDLPLIKNEKTVDPADSASPKVIQMETSMGSAVSVFPGATAIAVPRSRFLPVKTTNELALVRSDVYQLSDSYALVQQIEEVPQIKLDSKHYKTIDAFDKHFPQGVPSLKQAESLVVEGNWFFEADVVVKGTAKLSGEGNVSTGTVLS